MKLCHHGSFGRTILIVAVIMGFVLPSCEKDESLKLQYKKGEIQDSLIIEDTVDYTYNPTSYNFNYPDGVPKMDIPQDNPTTEEGVELGRMLFYDPILSGDSTLACGGCHKPGASFSDRGQQFSPGIDGSKGNRNAMKLVNVGYMKSFNWHGSASSLEEQALEPVTNPLEMKAEWPNVVERIQNTARYPKRFGEAFNSAVVTKEKVVEAIAQFERTLISFNAKYDKALRGEAFLSESELKGRDIFFTEKGDCFHCHGDPLFTDREFHNNGLDSTFSDDPGRFEVTGDPLDKGLFKTPTLRNVELTAPYMHDGRFQTLREVVDFYSEGLVHSNTIDPLMKKVDQGGIQLTEQEKDNLVAFLKTLTDKEFINNESHSNPFK